MEWKTIKVRFEECVCFIQLNRPDAKNTINALMVEECNKAIDLCSSEIKIIVMEGLPDIFCFGADFNNEISVNANQQQEEYNPESLYNLWMKMANGPFVIIAHVRGQVNAGGVGFVAASDIVIADNSAVFSLSELLFGLYPAMVLPFLIRKIGFQKANYLTLMTKPVTVQKAYEWGLVDAYHEKSSNLLRKHLSRLKILPKEGIKNYKKYMGSLNNIILEAKKEAIKANIEIFSDPQNVKMIRRFVEKKIYPWENIE